MFFYRVYGSLGFLCRQTMNKSKLFNNLNHVSPSVINLKTLLWKTYKKLKLSEALRQSILKQAFEGKLVPQDPNDETAEKLLERINQEKIKLEKGEQLSIQGL